MPFHEHILKFKGINKLVAFELSCDLKDSYWWHLNTVYKEDTTNVERL